MSHGQKVTFAIKDLRIKSLIQSCYFVKKKKKTEKLINTFIKGL